MAWTKLPPRKPLALPDGLSVALRRVRMRAFLEAFKICGHLTFACEKSGISKQTYYNWLERSHAEDGETTDPDYAIDGVPFAELMSEALEVVVETAERELWRRAVEGWDEPVFGKGEGRDAGVQVVGHIRKYSDNHLMFMLKGMRPEKYRDNAKIELEHSGGMEIEMTSARDRLAAKIQGMIDGREAQALEAGESVIDAETVTPDNGSNS